MCIPESNPRADETAYEEAGGYADNTSYTAISVGVGGHFTWTAPTVTDCPGPLDSSDCDYQAETDGTPTYFNAGIQAWMQKVRPQIKMRSLPYWSWIQWLIGNGDVNDLSTAIQSVSNYCSVYSIN